MDCDGLRDDRLDVLYGEAPPEARLRVEAHLATCAACREEMASLRALRGQLGLWKAPEVRPLLWRRARYRPLPLLAAAAGLLLALGAAAAAVRGFEARYEAGRFSLRLGGGADAATVEKALAEQESRHRKEIAELRARLGAVRLPASAPDGADPVVSQLADMIRDSEARQEARINQSLTRLAERTESRRRYDLARIGAGLAYLDGKNGQQLSRTTELMGYVLEAGQRGSER